MNKEKVRQRMREDIEHPTPPPTLRRLEQIPMRVACYHRGNIDELQQVSSTELFMRAATRMVSMIPAWSLAGVYSDRCLYNTPLSERPGFGSMKKNYADYDLIVCKSISALLPDTFTIVQWFREKDVGFYFEADDLYSMDDSFDSTLQCYMAMAEQESLQKRPFPRCRVNTDDLNLPSSADLQKGDYIALKQRSVIPT